MIQCGEADVDWRDEFSAYTPPWDMITHQIIISNSFCESFWVNKAEKNYIGNMGDCFLCVRAGWFIEI